MSRSRSPDQPQTSQERRKEQVRGAQVRLLYDNSATGFVVTAIAAPVLGWLQSLYVPYRVVLAWLVYMLLVSTARFILARRYRLASSNCPRNAEWSAAFAVGAGLAGGGWGGAGILLYPTEHLISQVFLAFVLGGMMLGGASLLAPKPEAFLAFLLPTGLLPAIRLVFEGDKEHIAMGLLATLFTVSVLITTWRFHHAIASSLNLQFENQDLLHDLQIAHDETQALNQQLEARVQERTAELQQSAARLRTEIKQRETMEEELLRVRHLESLGVLAGGIAHDFNNFVTVVQGNIELAQMQLDPGAPIQRILEQTTSACQRATYLSSQLLTFAKGGAPIRHVVSVARLVLDAVQLARAGAPISIGVDIAQDLWPAEVDADQIGQVLHNILLNAKQSMPPGGSIEVRAENLALDADREPSSRAFVRISIRDHGTGIPADILPRIFDPYFTTKQGGSGLGLATVHAIVSKHGGRVSLDSKCGEGTVFIVDLPASPKSPEDPPIGTRPRSGTGRLLVMDDEEALRMLLERVLTTLGYQVQSARHGAEAIAMYEAAMASGHRFDAVLLDVTVNGGMGGIETAARLRKLDPSANLIVSSGYSDAPVMSQFREYGFDDVIPKPWKAAQLSEVFRRVLAPEADRKAD